ncbi:MAG: retropepsin-like domain-containing protein [Candidatus Delongbacteria bacterium]|nr:retropepsin-like domain-containing protein [Candidatus Delongbacteria bacterium]
MKKIGFIVFLSICCSLNFGQENTSHKYKIIPIDYRGHIYIDGSVNDVKGHFIVDTGADNLYFDSLFYAAGNLKYDSIITARVPGAGKELQKVKVIMNPVQFDFHSLNYRTQSVPVISLKPIVGDFADGIIGQDYFSQKILEINYARNYMKIHDKIDSLSLGHYAKI